MKHTRQHPLPFRTALITLATVLVTPETARADEGEAIGGWFPGTALFALTLVAVHLAAPWIRRRLQGWEPIVESLGGGMAIGYVFVHLLPELDKGHALLGRWIFAIALASFVLYYGIEKYLHVRRTRHPDQGETHDTFYFILIHLWIYNWLIVYGTPAEAAENGWRSISVVLALALHLIHSDFAFGTISPKLFDKVGRYVLATAPFAGWLTATWEGKTNESINDIFVALLAGTLLYKVFKEELPDHDESRFAWFLVGVGGFVAFIALTLVGG